MPKKLLRSNDRLLGGVCSGIADYFELDPTLIRVGYFVLSILSVAFPGILVYVLLWIIVPARG